MKHVMLECRVIKATLIFVLFVQNLKLNIYTFCPVTFNVTKKKVKQIVKIAVLRQFCFYC